MTTSCCAVLGCSPSCFPWGYDEEEEACAALKLLLLREISRLQGEGTSRFTVCMDPGVGLYAAEILLSLRQEERNAPELICHIPYEDLATKWTPGLRERYFSVLAACTEVKIAAPREIPGCAFDASLRAMTEAETLIVIYDPEDPGCEREAAIVSVARLLGKQIYTLNPKEIHI